MHIQSAKILRNNKTTKELQPKELKFPDFDSLFPAVPDSSRILAGCRRSDYSASRVATAVEDCDAHLLNLNVTDLGDEEMPVVFDLRVNLRNAESVARSLERYGYRILLAESGDRADDTTLRERLDEVLRYINM